VSATRIDYYAVWLRDVRAGKHGQSLARPSTWTLDEVWRAAGYARRAIETERLLAYALDHNLSVLTIRALLADVYADRARAARASLGYPITEDDKRAMQWRRRYGQQHGWPLSPMEAASLDNLETHDAARRFRQRCEAETRRATPHATVPRESIHAT
jgi:hypothetical protein